MEKLISKNLEEKISIIGNILDEIGERIEGNLICDVKSDNFTYERNEDKIFNLQNLVNGKNKVCEIGVNAGHSLLIMLEKNPDAEYYLFDLGLHKYTDPCVDRIKSLFPNTKINIIYGDSKKTLEDFISFYPHHLGTFDLVHIDGGHGEMEFISDFYYSRLLCKIEGITIFDDYNYSNIKDFLDIRIEGNIISEYLGTEIKKNNRQLIYTR